MTYQIGLIVAVIVVALLVSKKINKRSGKNDQLIYEDEMSEDELKEIDGELD